MPQVLVERLHERVVLCFDQVPLVRDDDDAAAGAVGFAADRGILIGRTGLGVDDQRHDVGIRNRFFRQRDADHLDVATA